MTHNCPNCGHHFDDWDDDETWDDEEMSEEDMRQWYEDEKEREYEQLMETAAACKCGALQIVNHEVIHVADCCCGAY